MRAIPHPVEIGLGFPYLFLLISAFVRREGISLPNIGNELWNKVLPRQFHLTTPAPVLNYSAIDKPIQPNDTHYPPLRALSHGLQAFILFSNSTAAEVEGWVDTPEGNITYSFAADNASLYKDLRAHFGLGEEVFLKSLCGPSPFNEFISNSKSRQFFCFSPCGQFMIKTMKQEELTALREILPYYYVYMRRFPGSLIVKYCGTYHVTIKKNGKKEDEMHFVVMKNILSLPAEEITERYDVKGSKVGRACSEAEKKLPLTIFKDLDLIRRKSKVNFGRAKRPWMHQVFRDVRFLEELNIMDYSLLIGISPRKDTKLTPGQVWGNVLSVILGPSPEAVKESKRLEDFSIIPHPNGSEIYQVGIIDILQKYNTRKKAENFLKSCVYEPFEISAIPSRDYARRFLRFLRFNIGEENPPKPFRWNLWKKFR